MNITDKQGNKNTIKCKDNKRISQYGLACVDRKSKYKETRPFCEWGTWTRQPAARQEPRPSLVDRVTDAVDTTHTLIRPRGACARQPASFIPAAQLHASPNSPFPASPCLTLFPSLLLLLFPYFTSMSTSSYIPPNMEDQPNLTHRNSILLKLERLLYKFFFLSLYIKPTHLILPLSPNK